MCLEAKCNETILQQYIKDLNDSISVAENFLQKTLTAKTNVRLAIDCQYVRSAFFDKYEELAKRSFLIGNSLKELRVKAEMFNAEVGRCKNRSKI